MDLYRYPRKGNFAPSFVKCWENIYWRSGSTCVVYQFDVGDGLRQSSFHIHLKFGDIIRALTKLADVDETAVRMLEAAKEPKDLSKEKEQLGL